MARIESEAVREAVCEIYARPFEWGVSDCVLCVTQVLERFGFPDYSKGFCYDDEAGAKRIIESRGGLAGLVARCVEPDGWFECQFVDRGSIGIVETPLGPALAITDKTHWFARTMRGISMLKLARGSMAWTHPRLNATEFWYG